MSSDKQKLSDRQKKMVAIGASVGVGCLPCASFHFNDGRRSGFDDDLMLAAVLEAERVLADARERAASHMRNELAAESPGSKSDDKMLAAFGAAVGSNSLPNIRRYLIRGAESGLSGEQLAEAIAVAEGVQQAAARGHIKETRRFLERYGASLVPLGEDAPCGYDCSCVTSKEATDVV